MTSRERNLERYRRMLDEAAAAGHTMKIEFREAPAGTKGPTKYWLVCDCGYTSTARRSPAAAISTLAWHAGGVAGEAEGRAARVNGGVSLSRPAMPGL